MGTRRQFLTNLIKAVVVGSVVIITPTFAFASVNNNEYEELEKKAKRGEKLTQLECKQLAWYMNNTRNGSRIIHSWSCLQPNMDNLFSIHPLVAMTVVWAVTGERPDKVEQAVWDENGDLIKNW